MSNSGYLTLDGLFTQGPTDRKPKSRFEFLDGYRGFLTLTVVLQHAQGYFQLTDDYRIFRNIGYVWLKTS